MATLTDVSKIARKTIKFGIIGLIAIMIAPVVIKGARNLWLQIHPPPPAAPTVRYGKLPQLVFPTTGEETKPEYTLQTIEGGLPALDTVGRVYLVGINKSRLSSLDRIRNMAKTLGFNNDFIPLDDKTYKFVHSTVPAEIITNIVSWEFSYRYDWTSEKGIAGLHTIPIGTQAVTSAKTYFQKIGLLQDDLNNGTAQIKYLAATGSAMVPVESYYDANFTRVDLVRANKDNLRFMSPGGDTTPVNITFTPLVGDKSIAQANYQYSLTVDNDYATYPLKGTQQAWNELITGKGYVAKQSTQKVIVRKVSLGYYEASQPQAFLQPIYIFEGDGGFTAYVQAVSTSYLSTPNQ